jgi:hypothetical protein
MLLKTKQRRNTMSYPKIQLRPSPALLVAFLALFIAMGGAGYAAVKLKRNSVKTKNIRDAAVTTAKLAPDAKAPLAGVADTAKNAQQLAGVSPDALRTDSAYIEDPSRVELDPGPTNVAFVTLKTTTAKRITAVGSVNADSSSTGGDFVTCSIAIDGAVGLPATQLIQKNAGFGTVTGSVAPIGSAVADAGTHMIALACKGEASSPDGVVTGASLSATAVPVG